MAAIGKLRKYYVLCMIVVGVALLAFIVGDFSKRNRNPYGKPIGVIDGEKISYTDFYNKVNEEMAMRKNNTDAQTLSKMEFSIKENLWNDMVKQILLNKQCNKLGLVISKEELNDLIRGKSPHQYIVANFTNPSTGQVNYEQIDYLLKNLNNPNIVNPEMKSSYLFLESTIKKEAKEQKYNALMSKGFYVPTAFALKEHNDKYTKYDVQFVALRYKDLPDSAFTVTKAELQKYYNAHKEEYKIDESREIEYVEYQVLPTQADRDAMKKDVELLYEQFQNAVDVNTFLSFESETRPYVDYWVKPEELSPNMMDRVITAHANEYIEPFEENGQWHFAKVLAVENRPDSIKASHILIAYQGAMNSAQTNTRTKEEAENEANQILNIVKSSPNQFGTLAKANSDDPSNKDKNGELGWFEDGAMVSEFNNFVVENKVGTVGIVETSFGYHIVRIEDKSDLSKKIKIAEFTRSITASEDTHTTAYFVMSNVAANSKTYDELITAAKENGLNVRPLTLSRNSSGLMNVPNSRDVVKWCFDQKTKKGNVSKIYEFDGNLYVAALKTISNKGYNSLDNVESIIKPLVIREKKAEKLLQEMQLAKDKYKNINAISENLNISIEQADVTCNISNLPTFGLEPYVIGAMFAAPENLLSGPTKGDQAIYVFTKTLKESPSEKTDFTDDQNRLETNVTSRITRNAISTLEEKVKIEDNKLIFF